MVPVGPGPRSGGGPGAFWRTQGALEYNDFPPSLCPGGCSPGLPSSILPSLPSSPSPRQPWKNISMVDQTLSLLTQLLPWLPVTIRLKLSAFPTAQRTQSGPASATSPPSSELQSCCCVSYPSSGICTCCSFCLELFLSWLLGLSSERPP